MFERIETILDDLRLFVFDPKVVRIPLSFASHEAGAGLLQLAAGRTPAALESRKPDTPDFQAAQRFLACVVFNPKNSYFTLLCVDRNAPDKTIKDNYRRLIALVHPDANPIGFPLDAASRVNLGYAVLSNAEKRASYAESLDLLPTISTVAAKEHQSQPIRANTRSRSQRPSAPRSLFAWIKRPRFGFGLLTLASVLTLPVVVILANMANDTGGERLISGDPERSEKKQAPLGVESGTISSTGSLNSFDEANVAAVTENNLSSMRPKSSPRSDSSISTNSIVVAAAEATKAQRDAPEQGAFGLSNGAPSPVPRTTFGANPTAMRLSLAPVPSRLLDQTEPAAGVPEAQFPRAVAPQPEMPVLVDAKPLNATGAPATTQSTVKAQPTAAAQILPAAAPQVFEARSRDSEDVLLRFGSAYEQGSIDNVQALFASTMPGRSQMIADYQRVFLNTRQRNIRFLQLKHTLAGQRITTVGQAVVNTIGADNKSSSQRVFLEIDVTRVGNDVRIERMSNYALD